MLNDRLYVIVLSGRNIVGSSYQVAVVVLLTTCIVLSFIVMCCRGYCNAKAHDDASLLDVLTS